MKRFTKVCLAILLAILLCSCKKEYTHKSIPNPDSAETTDSGRTDTDGESSSGNDENGDASKDSKENQAAVSKEDKDKSKAENKGNSSKKDEKKSGQTNNKKPSGQQGSGQTTVVETKHNYNGKITKVATCTQNGVKTYTCKKCGDSYTVKIPASGHSYIAKVTKPATFTEAGVKTYTCKKCGSSYNAAIPTVFDEDLEKVKTAIRQTKEYIEEKEMETNVFSNILQSKLEQSLVYNTGTDEDLILYNEGYFVYKDQEVKRVSSVDYPIYNNVEEALDQGSVGAVVLTKGYASAYDGGNACFYIKAYEKEETAYVISDAGKTRSLVYATYDSTINLNQMGYKSGENISTYVHHFTRNLEYQCLFIPKGEYKLVENFDLNVSNKSYYGYETRLYSDDTFNQDGGVDGCVFYVFNNVQNIKINGFDAEVFVNKKLAAPLVGLLSARDVDGLEIKNCSFYLPKEAAIYPSSGMIDFFTGWKNVVVKNCHLENHASTVGGGGIGFRDIYKKGCENALFENNYVYSNCKDEVIAIFSGGDTSLYPNETGGGYINHVVLKDNTIVGGKPNEEIGPRVVGLTVGYQLSPVHDIQFIGNEIEMYSANYLLIYGKADALTLKENVIKMDSSYQDKLYMLFWHNVYAEAGTNITIDQNEFEMLEGCTLNTICQTGEEFKFTNNTFTCEESIERIFDSNSVFENNTFNIGRVSGCIYHNIKEVKNNTINADYLNTVFEFYNLDIQEDIRVASDQITTKSIGANFMMFNGWDIKFNNHTVTFDSLKFTTDSVNSVYYYLAYGTSPIKDHAVIKFVNSELSVYEKEKHNYVAGDPDQKVTVQFLP